MVSARAGSTLDADELRRINDQLIELQEKKRILASLVVHDLRNPLSALMGNLDLLSEQLDPRTEMVDELLEACQQLTKKALSLVAGLLDVEELEAGLLQAQPSPARVRDFATAAADSHGPTIQLRELDLQIDIPEDLVAEFDADLIGRVVENLLDNATRYAKRKGRVEVSAALEGGELVLCVGNDGPPVPVEEREQIFGRYYRIEARRANARANRGLGLYFCKLVAEAHGGAIEVTQREGLPTCFVVRIPQPVRLPNARSSQPNAVST